MAISTDIIEEDSQEDFEIDEIEVPDKIENEILDLEEDEIKNETLDLTPDEKSENETLDIASESVSEYEFSTPDIDDNPNQDTIIDSPIEQPEQIGDVAENYDEKILIESQKQTDLLQKIFDKEGLA